MTNEQTEQTEQEPQSVIIIEFAQLGSAEPQSIQCKNISPGQFHAAASRLQLIANRQIEKMWDVAEMKAAREMAEMAQMQQILRVDTAD